MYRFRRIDSLIGQHQELEKQEIYFATPEELNDPMEGFKNMFWDGDEIVWTNFIINYVKSLERVFSLMVLLNDEKKISEKDIKVSHEIVKLTSFNKTIIDEVLIKVFQINHIKKLPVNLSKRKTRIRRFELLAYLMMAHPFILKAISDVYVNKGITNKPYINDNLKGFAGQINTTEHLPKLANILSDKRGVKVVDSIFSILNQNYQSTLLTNRYKYEEFIVKSNAYFVFSEFPNKFISRLESEIYPPWFSASFLFENKNSVLWGHYGDNHKGVCLKFKTQEKDDRTFLRLDTEYGYSEGPTRGMRPHFFRKIKYDNKHVEIDFFRSIARMSKPQLNKLWYKDTKGNLSICGKHLNENEEHWRGNYWNNFYDSLEVKLKEWEYEEEYRLIIHGDFTDYTTKESRKLKYDFNDLESITFGIKTENSSKTEIMRIIQKKCKELNISDFYFYQAYYSQETGQIESFKLNLLNL
ncbi:MAG: DUF2971 domain-containing protein [Ignavibacteriae bacterium]|nr:DUF2971 domain-containing protein [Ignavibacteriota bacterium]